MGSALLTTEFINLIDTIYSPIMITIIIGLYIDWLRPVAERQNACKISLLRMHMRNIESKKSLLVFKSMSELFFGLYIYYFCVSFGANDVRDNRCIVDFTVKLKIRLKITLLVLAIIY